MDLKKVYEHKLLGWYDNTVVLPELKKHPSIYNQNEGSLRPYRDYWNLYSYGAILKCVYIKASAKPKKPADGKKQNIITSTVDESERFKQSISRTKAKVFEIAMCNEFRFFCTFTIDEKKQDRYDLKTFVQKLSMMIRNINRGREEANKIRYLLIPEPHKNGAWHLHGLFMGLENELTEFKTSDNIPLKLKKMIKNGEKVYNWAIYAEKFGFFTATEVSSNEACARYVTKYITKDLTHAAHKTGSHLFYASQGLNRRETIIKNCVDKCFVDDWDFENDYVKIKEITVPKKGQ